MTIGHCESSLGLFDELQNSAQVAVDPQTKPPDLGCESAYRQISSTTTISPKADTHLPSHVG